MSDLRSIYRIDLFWLWLFNLLGVLVNVVVAFIYQPLPVAIIFCGVNVVVLSFLLIRRVRQFQQFRVDEVD